MVAVNLEPRFYLPPMNDPLVARAHPFRSAPNLLTLLRICLAPVLVSTVLEGRFQLSLALFLVAGLTDALDGTLARLLHQRSMLGAYLDPVADKLLLSALFVVLAYRGLIPTRITVLVLGRDVGILLVAAILYAAAGRREFQPSMIGKANTCAQVATVAVVLYYQINTGPWVGFTLAAGLNATMALTVLSGLQYAWLVSHRSASVQNGSMPNGHAAEHAKQPTTMAGK